MVGQSATWFSRMNEQFLFADVLSTRSEASSEQLMINCSEDASELAKETSVK